MSQRTGSIRVSRQARSRSIRTWMDGQSRKNRHPCVSSRSPRSSITSSTTCAVPCSTRQIAWSRRACTCSSSTSAIRRPSAFVRSMRSCTTCRCSLRTARDIRIRKVYGLPVRPSCSTTSSKGCPTCRWRTSIRAMVSPSSSTSACRPCSTMATRSFCPCPITHCGRPAPRSRVVIPCTTSAMRRRSGIPTLMTFAPRLRRVPRPSSSSIPTIPQVRCTRARCCRKLSTSPASISS